MSKRKLAAMRAVSDTYVASLDRTSLRAFAFPLEILSAFDTLQRAAMLKDYSIKSMARERVSELLDEHGYALGMANVELLFWWRETSEPFWELRSKSLDSYFISRIDHYGLINAHPEMHEYFAVDLWGTAFIERCISDGIDAELAVSLAAAA